MAAWTDLIFTGAIGTTLGTIATSILGRRRAVNEALLKERTALYQELWRSTKVIPRWPRNPDLTRGEVRALSEHLRDWYFEKGGIYLSKRARAAYGDLQEVLCEICDAKHPAAARVPEASYMRAQRAASWVRTCLTRDLRSRAGVPLM